MVTNELESIKELAIIIFRVNVYQKQIECIQYANVSGATTIRILYRNIYIYIHKGLIRACAKYPCFDFGVIEDLFSVTII